MDMPVNGDEFVGQQFSKENPSPRYLQLLDQYATMHSGGRPEVNRTAGETFAGRSLQNEVEHIARLVAETGATTMLDFGAGKGVLYQDAPGYPRSSRYKTLAEWGDVLVVTCYDPAYEPFSAAFDDTYDAVIATDVVEPVRNNHALVRSAFFADGYHRRSIVSAMPLPPVGRIPKLQVQ